MTRHKERFGLYSPDAQSVTCTRADLVSQTSRLVVHRAFAHISAHRYERAWQQPWGLSVRQGHPCSFRVMGHRCPRRTTPLAQYRPPGCDHPSLGLWQGQPICDLAQPHPLETADLQAMGACTEAHDFTCTIWGYGAWYSPGNVLRVAWWNTPLRAALLHQSVQTPGLAYAKKVTQQHRIVHWSGEAAVAGVAYRQPHLYQGLHLLHPGDTRRGWSVWQTCVVLVADKQGRKVQESLKSSPETKLITEGYPCQQGTNHSLAVRATNNDHNLKETEDIWTPI